MSVAALKPKTITIANAVEVIWEHIAAKKSPTISRAVWELWPSFEFEPTALVSLAMDGLIYRARDTENKSRHGRAVPLAAPNLAANRAYVNALAYRYRGADGQQKPLIEFNLTDLAYFSTYAGTMEQSWKRRRVWASETQELMQEHGAVTVGKLPPHVLKSVAQAASEAMGSQE